MYSSQGFSILSTWVSSSGIKQGNTEETYWCFSKQGSQKLVGFFWFPLQYQLTGGPSLPPLSLCQGQGVDDVGTAELSSGKPAAKESGDGPRNRWLKKEQRVTPWARGTG